MHKAPAMYKILVVDDEAIETEAMWRIISAKYGDKCVVDMALNGKMAIAKATEMRADIVIMDIEMPGINGLEAAKVIRETLPWCRVIIVTAYERFQYAQVAISLGAEDYLLKPVANADLFALLDKTMAEIDAEHEDEAHTQALDSLAREQLVLSVISGYSTEAALTRQMGELGLSFQYGFFCVMKAAQQEAAQEVSSRLIADAHALKDAQILSFAYDDSLSLMVLMGPVFYSEEEVFEGLSASVKRIRETTGLSLKAGIGPIVTTPGDLQRSYHWALDALERGTTEEPVHIQAVDIITPLADRGLERRVYAYLLEKNMDAALSTVDAMLDAFFFTLEQPLEVGRMAAKALRMVAAKLQRDARAQDDLTAPIAALEERAMSRQEMIICIRGLLTEWFQALDAQPVARMQRIRTEIERFIQTHYAEDLSIKRVAQAMHYSEPYFSKLFSRCFHKNFVTYLTDIRMQAARDMLVGSMESVRDISIAVGFADANYFAKVFRKTYGISPTEYRRFAYGQDGQDEGSGA